MTEVEMLRKQLTETSSKLDAALDREMRLEAKVQVAVIGLTQLLTRITARDNWYIGSGRDSLTARVTSLLTKIRSMP